MDERQPSESYGSFLPENDAEVARLLVLHHFLARWTGDILPASLDLSHVQRVLDVACGVGAWVHAMAQRYPAMQIVGIDKSAYLISQARTLKWSKERTNASFVVQDLQHIQADLFPPASLDLVHMRDLIGKISPQELPTLLQTLMHFLRQGAFICWQEAELPVTNSPAYERFRALVLQALQVAGRAFAPGNSSLGITACTGSYLRNAGCRIKQDSVHAIDLSAGTPAHANFARQGWAFGHQVSSFLLATGVTTAPEFESLLLHMQQEVQADTFCGLCFLRMVVATKRHDDDPPEPIFWR